MDNDIPKPNQILTMQKAVKTYGLNVQTLRKWADEGHLHSWRSPSNTRMFNSTDINKFLKLDKHQNITQQRQIVYCRVSSAKQKDDLERQIELLKHRYPDHDLVSDIGSGINFHRKGLQTILELCLRRELKEVVVAHKDRLCRFAFDLVKSIIEKSGGRIIVLDEDHEKSDEQELAEDLLSIIHVFSCRQMGKRRYSTPKEIQDEFENKKN
jgi:putative resolvase